MKHSSFFGMVIILAGSAISSILPKAYAQSADYRLPRDVIPISYKVFMTPVLANDSYFKGETEIVIQVMATTNKIVLHARRLEINSVSLKGSNRESLLATPRPINKINDFLIIEVDKPLIAANNYVLNLSFRGELGNNGLGFYVLRREDHFGEVRSIAATQFQPTHARQAFPCWDEPDLKATFDISIKHSKKLHALSNTRVLRTIIDPLDSTYEITTFETTPKMSTYLVAFVVSDYQALSNENRFFKIWAEPEVIQRGKYFEEISEKMLKELDTYTGIPYASHGLGKMDLVILPIEKKAMENWGLITCSDKFLPTTENPTTINGVAVLMHEFVHQWFGNLVSPKRWQYTWLNEGFAAYFNYVMTDKIWPQWRLKYRQVIQDLQETAFRFDSQSTAKSMNHDIDNPKRIMRKFDGISYQKGGSIIRMIAHVLGEDKFQSALRAYLNKKKFQAATPDDLFTEFINVFPTWTELKAIPSEILNNWVNTPGFPVINIIRNYENNTLEITQERFMTDINPKYTRNDSYYVPLNYATQQRKDFDDTTITIWLDNLHTVKKMNENLNGNEWVIFNKQQFGYYRVNYDEQNWNLIAKFLQSQRYKEIHVLNRAQLVDDALKLAEMRRLKWDIALYVVQFLEQEVDDIPWYPALKDHSTLIMLWQKLIGSEFYEQFQNYLQRLLRNAVTDVRLNEIPKDDIFRYQHRRLITDLACLVKLKSCIDEASSIVENWLEDPKQNSTPSDITFEIMCAALHNADNKTWTAVFTKYWTHRVGNDKRLFAFACTPNTELLIHYYWSRIIETADFSKYAWDLLACLKNVLNGTDRFLDYIIAHPAKIRNSLHDEVPDFIASLFTTSVETEAQLEKVLGLPDDFVKNLSVQIVNDVKRKINWLNSHREELTRFFHK